MAALHVAELVVFFFTMPILLLRRKGAWEKVSSRWLLWYYLAMLTLANPFTPFLLDLGYRGTLVLI